MNAYRLAWKREPVGLIDGSVLRPDLLAGMSRDEVSRLPLRCGRREYPLGELCNVTQEAASDSPRLAMAGAGNLVRLGAGMKCGILEVDGAGGALVGAEMRGGEIRIHGPVGPLCGAAMRGGVIVVDGDAGESIGAPLPGGMVGMTGGEILVHGSAGPRAGMRQRRGLIAVGGSAEEFPGYHMLAGTIVVAKGNIDSAGCRMVRGSIVALSARPRPLPVFGRDGLTRPVWLPLLWRRLAELGFPLPGDLSASWFESFTGDCLMQNRGELLFRAGN